MFQVFMLATEELSLHIKENTRMNSSSKKVFPKALIIVLKIIFTIAMLILSAHLGLTGFFKMYGYSRAMMYAGLVTPLVFVPLVWFKNKKRMCAYACVILVGAWTVTGFTYMHHKAELKKVVKTDVNIELSEYLPFDKDSKIALLSEDSTLHLTTDLPKLDGAAALYPVYSAFVNAVYPEYAVEDLNTDCDYAGIFNYFNTVSGYRALAEKATDIFFGAYPSDEQLEYAKEQGTEFEFTPIGKEAFVFFVNVNSDVDNLSSDDIRRIYSGEITDWSQLGFKAGEIKAFQRNQGSGSQSMFLRFMGDVEPMEPIKNQEVDFMMGAYDVVADYVNNRGAIGFSFRYYLDTIVHRDDVKMISVDGIAPTIENIRSGAYPISGDFYAVTWKGNPNEQVQVLLDWICGPQGQELIEKTGYAPLD